MMPDIPSSRPLLLAPAGDFSCLRAGLDAGADAVYFGVGALNMRAGGAANFQPEDLREVVRQAHDSGAKAFLAVNTVIYDSEMDELDRLCDAARDAGVDACIAGDMAAISRLRARRLPVHLTVQCNISNLEAVRFYAQFADVMVLARELPLESIRYIVNGIRDQRITGPSGELVRVEIFIHGALCVALSGRCSMSLATCNTSANRGACHQPCRRRYLVRDAETGAELEIDNQYVMSPGDLRTVGFLDRILDAGPSVLKIEGRGRSADYVRNTVSVYREAVDSWCGGAFDTARIPAWESRLAQVFHRGFWDGGYYLGRKIGEWSARSGSCSTLVKTHAGKITNFFARVGAAEMRVEGISLHPGDTIQITGPTTGVLDLVLTELRLDRTPVPEVRHGDIASFPVPGKVRCGDRVQILTERREND